MRQLISDRSLYSFLIEHNRYIPDFQFAGDELVPNIARVNRALSTEMHPVEIYNWYRLPNIDLFVDDDIDQSVSPLKCLKAGRDVEKMVFLANRLCALVAKLPNAPDLDRLWSLAPDLITLKAGTELNRIYRRGSAHPTLWDAFRHYGPTSARFDHHEPDTHGKPFDQTRGVAYFAGDGRTAIAEGFQEKRTVNRHVTRVWLVTIELTADLSLLNLTDTFCVQAAGSMKLVSGPTVYSQNWSRGFYEYYADIHGLYYPSSLINRPAVALYDRALAVKPFPSTPLYQRALDDALLIDPLRNTCTDIGYDFI